MNQTRRLIEIVARLRDPEHGCPWDRKQDFKSLIPYLLEEACEVRDAIEREDTDDFREELGDLLLQVAMHSRIAEELGLFDFESVAFNIAEKLIRRHPHVFGDAVFTNDEQRANAWETFKVSERRQKKADQTSVLAGIPAALPALMYAAKMQQRAAQHGFDWPETTPVFAKVEEELGELREAWQSGDEQHIHEELGDLLFVVVNLARHLKVEPELALHRASRKFEQRFRTIEERLQESGKSLDDCELRELDALWDEAKIVTATKPANS